MKNESIRIGLASVLVYLIFKKSFEILTSLILWVNVELKIENEFVLILSYTLIGIISILLLFYLFNIFIQHRVPKPNTIYILIGITLFLTLTLGLINTSYGNYLHDNKLGEYSGTYAIQYGNSKLLKMILPVFALVYFLWKLNKETKTVANNKSYEKYSKQNS